MRRNLLLASLLLFGFLWLRSQKRQDNQSSRLAYQKAEKLYHLSNPSGATDSMALVAFENAIRQFTASKNEHPLLFDSYLKAGILCLSNARYQTALDHFRHALDLAATATEIADSLLFQPNLFAGNACYNLQHSDTAFIYYKKAEQILQQYPDLEEAERLFNQMGVLYYETGDYNKSVRYFNKALALASANPEDNRMLLINYKNNIASALRKLQQYDEAINLYRSLLPENINANEVRHNIGATYLAAGNYPMAIQYLKQVGYSNAAKWNDLGRAYFLSGDTSQAASCFTKALQAYRSKENTAKNQDYGITLKSLGDFAASSNQPDSALQYYQQSIVQLASDFNDLNIARNPESYQGQHRYIELFETLLSKARLLKNRSTQQGNNSLKNAWNTYAAAIQLVRHIERLYDTDESRLFLKKKADIAFHEMAAVGLTLHQLTGEKEYLEKVFALIENNKASVLQADLHDLELNAIQGLPASLLEDQRKIKAELARLLLQTEQGAENSAAIRDGEIALTRIQEKLDEHPRYHALKFSNRQLSIRQLQDSLLQSETALVSYYYIEHQLVCFYLTKQNFGYTSTPIDSLFSTRILALRNALTYPVNNDRKGMQQQASNLFSQLIKPVLEKLKGKSRLIVIPYNEIAYIPFEMLMNPDTQEPLLKSFAIHYDYSANFLSREKNTSSAYQVLALAPYAGKYSEQDLPALPFSREEVGKLPGQVLMDKAATKDSFLHDLPDYPIVHLATHALANDISPMQSYIAFYDATRKHDPQHNLYAQEIYTLPLNHLQLVILSACETANGQLINGEGIMSLSRAFSYAGCPSVMASLWKADDAATAYISKRLHQYLEKGLPKDIALQKAKIDYLDDASIENRFKSPSYWSHLVLIGNSQPVTRSGNFWLILLSCLLFAGFMALLFKRKTVRR